MVEGDWSTMSEDRMKIWISDIIKYTNLSLGDLTSKIMKSMFYDRH